MSGKKNGMQISGGRSLLHLSPQMYGGGGEASLSYSCAALIKLSSSSPSSAGSSACVFFCFTCSNPSWNSRSEHLSPRCWTTVIQLPAPTLSMWDEPSSVVSIAGRRIWTKNKKHWWINCCFFSGRSPSLSPPFVSPVTLGLQSPPPSLFEITPGAWQLALHPGYPTHRPTTMSLRNKWTRSSAASARSRRSSSFFFATKDFFLLGCRSRLHLSRLRCGERRALLPGGSSLYSLGQ